MKIQAFIAFLLCLYTQVLAQDQKGGVDRPPSYRGLSIGDYYKRYYVAPKKLDTLVKPESSILHRIWRIIPMDDATNQAALGGCERPILSFPLIEIMKFGLQSGKVTAFPTANFNAPLQTKLSWETLHQQLILRDTLKETYFDSNGNSVEQKRTVQRELGNADVCGYLVTEDWFMDSHWGMLERRIVAICPIFRYKNNEERVLFWLYYNECRDLFASFEAYNQLRNGERITYDDVFLNHWFNSKINRYSNVYNRRIQDYMKDQDVSHEQAVKREGPFKEESDAFGN